MTGRLFLLAACLTCTSTALASPQPNPAAAGKSCFHEGQRMRVAGTLVRRWSYGPPNFGENRKTDKRVSIFVFRTATPLLPCDLPDFDNGNGDNGAPVKELVVVPFGKPHRLGKQSLTGTISHSVAGSQLLDYVFDVE